MKYADANLTNFFAEMCGKGVKKPRALAQLESANDDKSKLAKSFFSDDDDDDDDGDNDPIARTADGKKKKKNPIEEDTPSVVDEESQINSSTPAKRPPSASEKPEKKKTKKTAPKAKATPKQKGILDDYIFRSTGIKRKLTVCHFCF